MKANGSLCFKFDYSFEYKINKQEYQEPAFAQSPSQLQDMKWTYSLVKAGSLIYAIFFEKQFSFDTKKWLKMFVFTYI